MKLLTAEILKKFERVGSQDGLFAAAIIVAKFFTPDANWTWYALEYDPEYRQFFGWVDGTYPEYGSFTLKELQTVFGCYGLPVERDIHFTGKTMGDIQKFREIWPDKCKSVVSNA